MNEILEKYQKYDRKDLIPCMQHIQDQFGHINEEAITALSRYFGLPANKVYGIATFYDYFTFIPVSGDVVKICNGTSCHMQGSGKLLKEAEKVAQQISSTTRNRLTIKTCECQGACSAGPIMEVNGRIFTRVKLEEVKQTISRTVGTGKEVANG